MKGRVYPSPGEARYAVAPGEKTLLEDPSLDPTRPEARVPQLLPNSEAAAALAEAATDGDTVGFFSLQPHMLYFTF